MYLKMRVGSWGFEIFERMDKDYETGSRREVINKLTSAVAFEVTLKLFLFVLLIAEKLQQYSFLMQIVG